MRRSLAQRLGRARRSGASPWPTTDRPLPPAVGVDFTAPAAALWDERTNAVLHDTYVGVPLLKFPEDLRIYEHLLGLATPDVVIELGTNQGGSALWFRDRLRTLATYGRPTMARVITVDLEPSRATEWLSKADPGWDSSITLLDGDVTDPELPARVAAVVPNGARCLVTEDTAHCFETTSAALRGFADLVAPGGFFVVEDGIVDDAAVRRADWPRGVVPAINQFLAGPAGGRWRQRRDLELYGLTNNPGGILQRIN